MPSYLAGYPPELVDQADALIAAGKMGAILRRKYPQAHAVRTDKALYDYVQAMKGDYLRNAPPLARVAFDGKLQELRNALGTHTRISRVQGGRLKAKREIHVAAVFKAMPEEFLRMIVVHELAHLKEPEHDKAFYQLCCHMEPAYHQLEFDLRVYLSHLEAGGEALWAGN
ncbi:YgjP-like metallopeptidase domain-containing protein [Pseudothauera lacus]|uniref:Metal-dependent hydrolase n=1 Tax=Pseudothauera lacus TaxID=2136175 RepID=A0A2T4IEQ4_9RHOO|nr:YgjP-like metallopeptidase domain-containing protein [Pseudothauera lacus]PTD96265.1 metal-dependent hydrolase [Pseudothauera lacus]